MILKIVLIGVGMLVVLVLAIVAIGFALPAAHVARSEQLIAAPVEAVAARVRAVRNYPSWRSVTVENIVEGADGVSFVEVSDGDRLSFRLNETVPGRRFISTMTDNSLPFGGSWTIDLESRGAATLVRIEENGVIGNPLFRFVSRFVIGYQATMRTYLDALASAQTPPAG